MTSMTVIIIIVLLEFGPGSCSCCLVTTLTAVLTFVDIVTLRISCPVSYVSSIKHRTASVRLKGTKQGEARR